MSSIKRDIEAGRTTVKTSVEVTRIIIMVGLGFLILGLAIGGLFF